MTAAQFALLFSTLTLGAVIGMVIEALRERLDTTDPVTQAANEHDAILMDYLDRSECNLYFNPTLAAWGLLDGKDKMIATGRSVRTTLARAILNDKAEVFNG